MRKNGLVLLLIVIVLLVAGGFFAPTVYRWVDALSNPWAYADASGNSLTGKWSGQLNLSGQASRPFKLALRRDEMDGRKRQIRFARAGLFDGTAQVPDEAGRMLNYEVWGKTNRSGSDITMNFRPTNRQSETFKQAQWTQMKGRWQGTTLTLQGAADLVLYTGQGATSTSEDAPLSLSAQLKKEQ
jgi:hypothetical protein